MKSKKRALKIVSGGQTGVDRAALDAAHDLAKASGGWCPRGRRAEDGPIPAHYPLVETPSSDYKQRTRLNVQDSDGTLIITEGVLSGGTRLTANIAVELGRPLLTVDAMKPDLDAVDAWLSEHTIQTLNVAGPRESQRPGVYALAYAIVTALLRRTG